MSSSTPLPTLPTLPVYQKFETKKVTKPTQPVTGQFCEYFNTFYFGNQTPTELSLSSMNKSKSLMTINKSNVFVNAKTVDTNQCEKPNDNTIIHQVAFLLDATGSMNPYIQGTKKEIKSFIATMKENSEKVSEGYKICIQVAIVAYRDFTDANHFETLDFTDNTDLIEDFLGSIKATGGGDMPEDVKGSFIHALYGIDDFSRKLSWNETTDCASKVIVWLADAPPHNEKFTGVNVGDSYASDVFEDWKQLFSELKRLDCDLYIMKITKNTTVANETFKNIAVEKAVTITELDISQNVGVCSAEYGAVAFAASAASAASASGPTIFESSKAYSELSTPMILMQSEKTSSVAKFKSTTPSVTSVSYD